MFPIVLLSQSKRLILESPRTEQPWKTNTSWLRCYAIPHLVWVSLVHCSIILVLVSYVLRKYFPSSLPLTINSNL